TVGGEDETSGPAGGSGVRQHGSPRVRVRAGGGRMSAVLGEMVHALRTVTKAEAVALIHRDGAIVATALPEGISQETFSIMCAAILGAGTTALGFRDSLGAVLPSRLQGFGLNLREALIPPCRFVGAGPWSSG